MVILANVNKSLQSIIANLKVDMKEYGMKRFGLIAQKKWKLWIRKGKYNSIAQGKIFWRYVHGRLVKSRITKAKEAIKIRRTYSLVVWI